MLCHVDIYPEDRGWQVTPRHCVVLYCIVVFVHHSSQKLCETHPYNFYIYIYIYNCSYESSCSSLTYHKIQHVNSFTFANVKISPRIMYIYSYVFHDKNLLDKYSCMEWKVYCNQNCFRSFIQELYIF